MLQDIGSQNLKEKHIYTKVYIYIFIFFKQFGKNGGSQKTPLITTDQKTKQKKKIQKRMFVH